MHEASADDRSKIPAPRHFESEVKVLGSYPQIIGAFLLPPLSAFIHMWLTPPPAANHGRRPRGDWG